MTSKRSHGDGKTKKHKSRTRRTGGIEARGENSFRLRYRVNGKRFTKTFQGSSWDDANNEVLRLINSGNAGQHVAPDKMTMAAWVDHWIAIGAPGRRKKKVGRRTLERYAELLRCHVVPTLGTRPLQQLQATGIDELYTKLEGKMAPRTAHHVNTVLGACLGSAVRKGLLTSSPMARVEQVPSPGESDHGIALDKDELLKLVAGFKGSVLFPIVAVAAFTGARRNEVLALQWRDLDVAKKTLRIERAIEKLKKQPATLKGPKRDDHKRTITIDDDLLALLLGEREKHLRIKAGVPDSAAVDLSLVKLPDDALMFPNPPTAGEDFSFTKLRNPDNTTKEFTRKVAKTGFPGFHLHWLRGTHETLLLDNGVPVKDVAGRCGHDPVTLLRVYAKRSKKADTSAAVVIGAISKGVLGK
jgi:integrase